MEKIALKEFPKLETTESGVHANTRNNVRKLKRYFTENPFRLSTEYEGYFAESVMKWYEKKKAISDKQMNCLVEILNSHIKKSGL